MTLLRSLQISHYGIIGSTLPTTLPTLWTSSAGGRPAITRLNLDYCSPACKELGTYTLGADLTAAYLGKHPPPEHIIQYELLVRGVDTNKLSFPQLLYRECRSSEEFAILINNTDIGKLYRGASIPSLKYIYPFAPSGRLSLLREYGGKQRVFAIPSASVQIVLYPIHDRIFELFGSLPSDYTMDQNRFRRDMIYGKFQGRKS